MGKRQNQEKIKNKKATEPQEIKREKREIMMKNDIFTKEPNGHKIPSISDRRQQPYSS